MNEKLMFISAFQYNAIYSKDSGIAITTPVIESDKYEALQSQLAEANKVIEFYFKNTVAKEEFCNGDFAEHKVTGFQVSNKRARAYQEKYLKEEGGR